MSQCEGGARPETIVVDAAGFAAPGSDLEVCFTQDNVHTDARFCNEPGSPEVSQTWHRDYPDAVDYEVTRTDADGTVELLIDGAYLLQCLPGTVRLELADES